MNPPTCPSHPLSAIAAVQWAICSLVSVPVAHRRTSMFVVMSVAGRRIGFQCGLYHRPSTRMFDSSRAQQYCAF